jgi:hypothetical protein
MGTSARSHRAACAVATKNLSSSTNGSDIDSRHVAYSHVQFHTDCVAESGACQTRIVHAGQHWHPDISAVVDLDFPLILLEPMETAAMPRGVPLQETGIARISVPRRASSKPSPRWLPAARMIGGSSAGMAAHGSERSFLFLVKARVLQDEVIGGEAGL